MGHILQMGQVRHEGQMVQMIRVIQVDQVL